MLFFVMAFSGALFIPVLLLRTNEVFIKGFLVPELWQMVIVFGVFVLLAVDAIQYTAITEIYLQQKDEA